ncbi:MAG TPA: DUF2530 domain-containing protein, partial [Pilimelia sp.]|nr:DUF2530 domain-containing protein [Pilimelia sp.]
VPFMIGGIAAWTLTGLVLLVFFRDWLAAHDRTHWLWICAAGAGLGLVGLALMTRHDAHRRARRRPGAG